MARLLLAALLALQATAAPVISPPRNKYSPSEDVRLGIEAAAQAERQLPIMHDDEVTSFVTSIGDRLVAAVPPPLQHPEFRYSFKVVNVREINAFALPGGPMFVNRGMIQAAHNEGEVAGVMAHEISHVVLRHGTAQASEATKFEIGSIVGAIAGAVIGGRLGTVVSEGTRFGLGTYFLRYSREYERQADLEGAQIMARAGYDPRDMANVFKTIQQQGGPSAPEWLSDHPDPGNRYESILQEAQRLRVENPVGDSRRFEEVRAHLEQLPPAPTTEEATRAAARTGTARGGAPPSGSVAPPSARTSAYTEGRLFRVSVPSNWRELPSASAVTFAPQGAYGSLNGQDVFTHGMEFGNVRNERHDLETATGDLIDSLARGNPALRQASAFERTQIAGRAGIRVLLSNRSEATGRRESIQLYTTQLRDGTLFYALGVAPADEFRAYQPVFERAVASLQLMD